VTSLGSSQGGSVPGDTVAFRDFLSAMGSESRGVSREGGGPVPGPIIEELLGWESKELRLLYNSRVAVCGLLRAIPPACRHLLMRLLYLPNSDSSSIPYEVARASFESDRSYQAASTQLLDLKIMEREAIGNVISFTLNAAFAENLRKSISMDLEAPFQRVDGSVCHILTRRSEYN